MRTGACRRSSVTKRDAADGQRTVADLKAPAVASSAPSSGYYAKPAERLNAAATLDGGTPSDLHSTPAYMSARCGSSKIGVPLKTSKPIRDSARQRAQYGSPRFDMGPKRTLPPVSLASYESKDRNGPAAGLGPCAFAHRRYCGRVSPTGDHDADSEGHAVVTVPNAGRV